MQSLLVVDDDPQVRAGLKKYLLETSRLAVCEAATGREAIELARAQLPSAILLDLNLPDMTGMDVLDAVKGDPRTCGIPVLAFTAHHAEGQLAELREHGADGYLIKGGPWEQVRGYLEVLIKTSGPGEGEALVQGPVTIDPKLRAVLVSNKPIHPLTPREFDLLRYVARKSPEVVPWEKLAHAVWNEPKKYGKDSKTIELHAQRLRKKLGPEASGFLITHRGVGLQFITSIPHPIRRS